MRILPSVAGLALVALLLTGCLPQQPTDQPTPLPSSTPVFASDEEALAAAEAAYARYVAVSDAIAQDGGRDVERLKDLATPDWFEKEVKAFLTFSETGNHQTGSSSFRNTVLEQVSDDGTDTDLAIYVCYDSSGTKFIDSSGADVTPSNRVTLVSLEVVFRVNNAQPSDIRLASNEPWSGDSFC